MHRARDLGPSEIDAHRGIPVTSPPRTIIDLAAIVPDGRPVERLLDRAEHLRIGEVRALADARPGHRGARRTRRILATHAPGTTLTRSDLEELLVAQCRSYALPTPRVAGLEVDLVFPEQRVAVEADSGAYHGTRAAFDRDRERDAILTRAGYRVLRFSDTRSEHERATVAHAIAAALDDREPALSARALQA